jgi:diguanylate cyclase
MIEDLEQLVGVGLWHCDLQSRRIHLSRYAHSVLGMEGSSKSEYRIDDLLQVISADQRDKFLLILSELSVDQPSALFVADRANKGENASLEFKFQYLSKPFGSFPIVASVIQSEASSDLDAIRRMACFDSLTGLPNRLLFREQLTLAAKVAERDQSVFAVLSIEVGDLRRIADAYGRPVSDAIVTVAAQRLVSCIRSSDAISSGDPFARQGGLARLEGDRFAVVLSKLKEPQDAARVARRMIETMVAPINTDEVETYPPLWIGIALSPWDAADPDALMQSANLALDHARRSGVSRAIFFNRTMNHQAAERLSLETNLRKALDRREFVLYFQQRVDGRTGKLLGHEALIRWNHPEKGIVAPGAFIDVLETSRLIVPLGAWVLDEACAQNADWLAQGMPEVPVAVNISSVQFGAQGFVTSVRRALDLSGLPPHLLELEITESVVMGDTKHAIDRLREVKALGCQVAIDDFGTGFSSLSYLRDFPADFLKIDRSFVVAALRDRKSAAICNAIVDLGKRLELGVIAEGVETQEQALMLLGQGCEQFQGFLYSRPESVVLATRLWQMRCAAEGQVLFEVDMKAQIKEQFSTISNTKHFTLSRTTQIEPKTTAPTEGAIETNSSPM